MAVALQRELLVVPIVHSQAEMGTLGEKIRDQLAKKLGAQWVESHASAIDCLWDEIENSLERLDLPWHQVRIYQDGLPVCGREREIVNELAAAGSRNHRIVRRLAQNGATIMGTESGELLIQEYKRIKELLAVSSAEKVAESETLAKRDRFIAGRIDATLKRGEIGILFIGMLHGVQKFLAPDIHASILQPLARKAGARGRKLPSR